jgi:hypothetical protein
VRRWWLVVAVAGLALGFARDASACCQLGGTTCGDPFAVDCNNGVVCFIPWRTCNNCTCTTTAGGKTCLPTNAEPGTVPTLTVSRSASQPGSLDLAWGASCSASGPTYAVYEGAIGTWYSHEARLCSVAALFATLSPFGGNRYYLVAPVAGSFTGSLGSGPAGAERPDGSSSCAADRALAPCP